MRAYVDIDQRIAALAGAQGGVVSREQLISLGLGRGAIGRRVRGGRLHRLHRGVYAVGHRVVNREGRWRAAVLAAGPGAVLSHASAAAAWDLRGDGGSRVDVSIGPGGRAKRAGLTLHRRRLTAREVTTLRGVPITTVPRTLLDLAAQGLEGRPLESLIDRAEHRRLLDFTDLHRLAQANPARPGTPALRAVLAGYTATAPTRSELEERFLALCDAHGIRRPRTNERVHGIEVDFHWPEKDLVVEVDGYAWHRSPTTLAIDHERDVNLVLAGKRVLRFSFEQVIERPAYVAGAVTRAR
jgi:very-short-patch-repair endonuclease